MPRARKASRPAIPTAPLTQNRYRVTFTGNSVTPRETVESYLLLRAAEVTRAAGYSNFMFDTRNTKANHTYDTVPYGPPDPYFGRRRGLAIGAAGALPMTRWWMWWCAPTMRPMPKSCF